MPSRAVFSFQHHTRDPKKRNQNRVTDTIRATKARLTEKMGIFCLFFLHLTKIEKMKTHTITCFKYPKDHCEKLVCSYVHWERKRDINSARKF